jgi:threonine/homoserine/homoserine lactone efflux protein
MSINQWIALALFAFVASITPGPNNLMATTSGARFGLRRTIPQVAGVTFGFTALLWLAASGVALIVVEHPVIGTTLAVAGYAYLAWLSFKLLAAAWQPRSNAVAEVTALRPLTFWQAAAFQFANPKGWMMALSTATSFLAGPDRTLVAIVAVGLLFALINFPCVGAWALMGARLRRWLNDVSAPGRLRTFNGIMGAMLTATVIWMITLR